MNVFKRVFCRVFQFCFKVAIPFLPYYNPVILNNVDEIPDILKQKKIDKILFVTDKNIKQIGLTNSLEQALKDNNISYFMYDEFVSNPTVENVEQAKEIYLQNSCQALIGFGGGSAIDCAKAIGARIAKPKQQLKDMAGILRIFRKIPLLVAVPTTAGTGSETTVATVITDTKLKHKYMISDFPLIPKYAVLDAEITKSLPKSITASCGMDVLVHAIEAYIGNSTTAKTRRQALKTAELVYNNILDAYQDGNNLKARKNMLEASYLGGCAFTVSYVGYCHAISHSLSGMYNTPHGLANAIIIPYVLEAYGKKIHKKLKDLALVTQVCKINTPEDEAAKLFIQSIKDLNSKMGIGTKIPDIKKEDIEMLSNLASKEANLVYPVPVLMDEKELQKFYYDLI